MNLPLAGQQPYQQPLIELRSLHRSFSEAGRVRSVIDISEAVIVRGERVALVGRSGSGKSTLLNLISGIDSPDRGEIRIGGLSLTGMSERERSLFRRRHIGFVYQFFNLIPTLTVLENVLLPLELNGIKGRVAYDRAEEALGAVGLAERHASFPDRLSGGEQQRVAIARALVHEPLLVLADEPTGNLDAETGSEVIDLLSRLVVARHSTLLVVTHSPEVTAVCDRALVLRQGHIEPYDVKAR